MKGLAEMNSTKERVADATSHVRPYVERAIRDEELRRNVKDAYTSARALYDQLLARNDVSHVATKLVTDEDVQTQLRNVVAQLRSAAGRVHSVQEEEKKESTRSARNTLLLVAGIAVGLLVNPLTGPKLRGWLKKKVFGGGKGDGFVYHEGNGTHLN
jgi:response regulator RpfG family c-di-GMP phosphodiesterase